MQEISFYLVDAFSDRSFGGNAAVRLPADRMAAGRNAVENGAAAQSVGDRVFCAYG